MKKTLLTILSLYATNSMAEITPPSLPNPTDFGMDNLMHVALMLGLVLAIIILLSFFFKKTNLISKRLENIIKIISTRSIGSKEKLLVVEVEGAKFLIGVSTGNITHLYTFNDNEASSLNKSKSDFSDKLTLYCNQGENEC